VVQKVGAIDPQSPAGGSVNRPYLPGRSALRELSILDAQRCIA
jgi:hypothetical protein